MKGSNFLSVTLLFCFCTGISNCSSQSISNKQIILVVYEGTTPYDESIMKMLHLSHDLKSDMMKWKVTLSNEPGIQSPSKFELSCTYGLSKQGSRGFTEGARRVELEGICKIGQGINNNTKAIVYTFISDSSNISLSFFRPDQNLLCLLAADKNLVVGTGAWSYTLNRKELVYDSPKNFIPKLISEFKLTSDSTTIGIFEGRSPCNNAIKDIHGIPSPQCNLIKYQLTLFQDSISHTPSTFRLYTVYVGFGDNNVYTCTGTWKALQGTVADPDAIVYQLKPEQVNTQASILLQKADDNVLFFLDNDTRLLVGNDYCSYTLSRKRNR